MSKEYNRVPWLSMFLRTPLLCLKQMLVPIESVPFQGCQFPYLINVFALSLAGLPYIMGPWNSMLVGITNTKGMT